MNDTKSENNILKEAYSQIKAPEDWKKEILLKMQEEDKVIRENGKEVKPDSQKLIKGKKIQVFVSAGIMICVAAILLFFLLPKQAVYVTPMKPGEYYESVELKDGIINFKTERMVISVSPNAGQIGEDAPENKQDDNAAHLLDSKDLTSGGTLILRQNDNPLMKTIADDEWSYIGKQKVYVSVLKTKEQRYQAIYEKDGRPYEIIGTGVTQKEFIDYLYKQIKK